MTTHPKLRSLCLVLIATLFVSGVPFATAQAATSKIVVPATATLTTTSLSSPTGTKVIISGTTQNTSKIRFTITASSTTKTLFKSKTIKVYSGGKWSGTITKRLANGTYNVVVTNADPSRHEKLIQGTLVVGQPAAILTVSSIPLLGGGSAQPGQTIPVSYLQVQNLSASPVAIRGFTVTQTGSAGDGSVVAFSSIDGTGGSQASTLTAQPLSNGVAQVPSTAVLAPHERKLFTIKAQLSSLTRTFAGQSLLLGVTAVDADAQINATFPIAGATWIIAR